MERVYTIPLRNAKKVKRTIRAPRAIREVQSSMNLLIMKFGQEVFKKYLLKLL